MAVVERHGLDLPASVTAFLDSDAAETPKPGDPVFANASTHMIAAPSMSLEAAAEFARSAGVNVLQLGDAIEGESRDVAAEHGRLAMEIAAGKHEVKPPALLLSGGETTVTIAGNGRGGPNAEYALALAMVLGGQVGIHAIACDTDGIDGSEDNAGAMIGPDTLARADTADLAAFEYLSNNDAYGYFKAIDSLVMTGPTLTNVNDFRAILIEG